MALVSRCVPPAPVSYTHLDVYKRQVLGPKKPRSLKSAAAKRQSDPYECGLPSEISKSFRFGISFYLVAMLFILFDIEVVFLYPVGAILKSADSVFLLGEVILFVALLFVALVYVWRKGALDWLSLIHI